MRKKSSRVATTVKRKGKQSTTNNGVRIVVVVLQNGGGELVLRAFDFKQRSEVGVNTQDTDRVLARDLLYDMNGRVVLMEEVLALPAIPQSREIAPILCREQCMRSLVHEEAALNDARHGQLLRLQLKRKASPT